MPRFPIHHLLATVIALAASSHVHGATIALDFSGAVNEIVYFECLVPAPGGFCDSAVQTFVPNSDFFEGMSVSLDDVLSGTIVYQTGGEFDVSPDGTAANYRRNVIDFAAQLGGILLPSSGVMTSGAGDNLTIGNGSGDLFVAQTLFNSDEWEVFAALVLQDSDGLAFDSFDVPTNLSLADFSNASFSVSFRRLADANRLVVNGSVTSLTTTPVPLPASLWLFAGALASFALRGRRSV